MPDNNNGRSKRYKAMNKDDPDDLKKELKHNPAKAKWMRRMVLEVNKYPYSNSKNIGLYSFTETEAEWYYKKIRYLADKVLDILECPHCGDTITRAVMPGCGCDNPLACCSNCWTEVGSTCFHCKRKCTSLPFEPIDEIVGQCHLFFKEKAFNKDIVKCKEKELSRLCESYHQFLKQSEIQLMCDFCFGTLEKTMTINIGGGHNSRIQVCSGCHEDYMEHYSFCVEASPYPTFDRLNKEFSQFFSEVLGYFRKNKTQVFKDPHEDVKQPSWLRQRVIKRQQGLKGKFYGVFKKAVVVAACAYLVVYFVK